MQLMTEARTTSRRAAPARYSVLIADTSAESRSTLEAALSSLGPQTVTHAADGDELERRFFEDGPYDLVVCRALLGARSGLQVLARARTAGKRASFIVYSSLDGPWLRVFVSDAESTVLSSRVVSLEGVAQLAAGMLEAARR
ncbi:MAG TPA: response regulator [Polyangiaceae bacterium]|nr:response regulator [Polyangiaceae bacterium]